MEKRLCRICKYSYQCIEFKGNDYIWNGPCNDFFPRNLKNR